PAHVIAPAMRTNETASARPRDEFKLDQTTEARGGVLPTGKAPRNPESPNPSCDGVAQSPVIARIIAINVQGSEAIIGIAAGAGSGVQNHWSATVLRGDTDEPLAGGEVTIVRVDRVITIGKARLTPDQLHGNSRVRLTPPPQARCREDVTPKRIDPVDPY